MKLVGPTGLRRESLYPLRRSRAAISSGDAASPMATDSGAAKIRAELAKGPARSFSSIKREYRA